MSLPTLRSQINAYFTLEEIRALCFDLDIEYENLPGDIRLAKAQSLVEHCLRLHRLPDLISRCHELRPQVTWPDISSLPHFKPDSDDLFTVPFEKNLDFVGREVDLDELHKALQDVQGVGIRPVGLSGMGGIGKTQMAVEYCYRYQNNYLDGIFWINAVEPLRTGFAALGRRLQPGLIDRSQEVQIDAAAHYLRHHDHALLVLDNVTDSTILRKQVTPNLTPARLPRLLFTTRERQLSGFASIELTVLPEESALTLLLGTEARQPILDPRHPEHALACEICIMLGYLPLALEVAAAHLGEYADLSLADYVVELRRGGALAVLEQGDASTRHDLGLHAVLHSQYGRLPFEESRLLLQAAGQMPEAALIPKSRLSLFAGLPEKAERFFAMTLDKALEPLISASLVESLRGERLRLHPLVHDFAARLLDSDAANQLRETCGRNLANTFEDLAQLEQQCAARGIDALQEDLLTALNLLKGQQEARGKSINIPPWRIFTPDDLLTVKAHEDIDTLERLSNLLRLLQREAHTIRQWDGKNPTFAQQLLYRLQRLGLASWKDRARTLLHKHAEAKLESRWSSSRKEQQVERILRGHSDGVSAVAVTPDGSRVVSGSFDSTLKIWNLATGEEERAFSGHSDGISAVAVMPDGSRVISASYDGTLKVWNLATGEEDHTLTGHSDAVSAVTVTPDGTLAISAAYDKTLRIWDLVTGEELHTLTGHSDMVKAVAVTPDNQWIISGSSDNSLKVWDLAAGRESRTLTGHTDIVTAVAVTPDGQHAISASYDGTLKMWHLATGRVVRIHYNHSGLLNAVAISPDGEAVFVASYDGRPLRVWNLKTGEVASIPSGPLPHVWSIAVTPNGQQIISATDDHTLMVWNIAAKEVDYIADSHSSTYRAVVVTPNGQQAIFASDDHTLKIWNLTTGEEEGTLSGHSSKIRAVVVTPDGQQAVSASDDHTLIKWNLATRKAERVMRGHSLSVRTVGMMPDGQQIISTSDDHTFNVWDLNKGEVQHSFSRFSSWVRAITITPDGQRAIAACYDHTLKVWNLTTGVEEHILAGHSSIVMAVAITPDGQRIISASADQTLKVWDLPKGKELLTFCGHSNLVRDVMVTPSGQQVISVSDDQTVQVWNLATGEVLASMTLDGSLYCVAVSPVINVEAGRIPFVVGTAGGIAYRLDYYEAEGNTKLDNLGTVAR